MLNDFIRISKIPIGFEISKFLLLNLVKLRINFVLLGPIKNSITYSPSEGKLYN